MNLRIIVHDTNGHTPFKLYNTFQTKSNVSFGCPVIDIKFITNIIKPDNIAVYDEKYKICGKYPLTIITVFLVTSILERHNP